jgi:hypothetical protein
MDVRTVILNGFQVTVRDRFLWLNAFGFGIGRIDGWQFLVYRTGRKFRVVR